MRSRRNPLPPADPFTPRVSRTEGPVNRRTRTIGYTTLALIAFAANSVLCRIALSQTTIDPVTFSVIRFASGAVTLLLVTRGMNGAVQAEASWTSAAALALYAIPFAVAYTRLGAGTGALILFGSVQLTMLVAGLRSGERPHPVQWAGLGLAAFGLVYLVLPGLSAPPVSAAALMGLAGFSWGLYSLRGRRAAHPLAQTTKNFVRSVPLVIVAGLVTLPHVHAERRGILLAVASGALASGLGYVAWYAALRGLTALRAAVVQLAVPILAAAGGTIFLAEAIPARLVLCAIMVLGGIVLAIAGREKLSWRSGLSAG